MEQLVEAPAPRTSHIAYVTIRLLVGSCDYLLLAKHRKWGDFSFVGGHVEEPEMGDWSRAARREAEEEMWPLRHGAHFELSRIDGPPQWGPVSSRAAGGAPTVYRAAWFALQFTKDPEQMLSWLDSDEFLLVSVAALQGGYRKGLTTLIDRLTASVPLHSVPLAWPNSIDAARVGMRMQSRGI